MKTISKVISVSWIALFISVQPLTASMGGDTEIKQILAAAKKFAKPYGGPENQYKFRFLKRVKDYALVNRIPKDQRKGEVETIILKKVNGNWVGQTMGTSLIDWEKKIPELFR
jgi:hypothetical protein